MMQKRLLLLGTACLFTTGAAAADLTVIEPAPIYTDPLYDWTGFYVGINGGYGGGIFEHPFDVFDTEETLATGSLDITAGGFVYGVQAGYNWQFSENFLIGLEADIQGSTIDGRAYLDLDIGEGDLVVDADIGTSVDWFATLRPRIGWVNDRWVVYATGGLAWGQTTSSVDATINGTDVFEGAPFDTSYTLDRFGWTMGAGIEYALTDNITFKTEYLYTDFGTEEVVDLDLDGTSVTIDSTVAFHTVRAGLNFHF